MWIDVQGDRTCARNEWVGLPGRTMKGRVFTRRGCLPCFQKSVWGFCYWGGRDTDIGEGARLECWPLEYAPWGTWVLSSWVQGYRQGNDTHNFGITIQWHWAVGLELLWQLLYFNTLSLQRELELERGFVKDKNPLLSQAGGTIHSLLTSILHKPFWHYPKILVIDT